MKRLICLILLVLSFSAYSQKGIIKLEFIALKMGYWNEAEKTIKLEDEIRLFKSKIVINPTLIFVTLTSPNNDVKDEVYHWLSKKKVTENGYKWIEYTLQPYKEGEWDKFYLYYTTEGIYTGCALGTNAKMMLFVGKKKA